MSSSFGDEERSEDKETPSSFGGMASTARVSYARTHPLLLLSSPKTEQIIAVIHGSNVYSELERFQCCMAVSIDTYIAIVRFPD